MAASVPPSASSGSAAPSLHAPRPPRRVLIANRGEIVVRIARTCAAMGIDTVAVYSDADADGLHVRACDQAVRLTGTAASDTYLRADLMIGAARKTGADAIHPGFGFLAEDAAFAQLVLDEGLTWIGPQPDVISRMGDKLAAKAAMEAAGVPVLPGAALADPNGDDDATAAPDNGPADGRVDGSADGRVGGPDRPDELLALADTVGFPLMVKAAAGGGGKGMRVVHDRVDLPDAVDAARREASAAFGDGRLFLERYVARPRHLEVQVLGDTHGNVVHLFERECSIQRRHQKIVEESPSLAIDDEVRAALCTAAVDAATAIGYVNAGTVEFVADEALLARRRAGEDLDPRATFAFLEVNTRLQVEHPVTEEVVRVVGAGSGAVGAGDGRIDLVREQLLIAGGSPLTFAQDDLAQVGHAIEVRLYAEDPAAGDLPATGELAVFAPDPAVRWELGIAAGEIVSPYYDPMLAKAIASAPTRAEAAALLARALARTPIVGVTTNQDLLLAILRDASFLDADTTTAYLDERRDLLLVDPDDDTLTTAAMLVALHTAVRRRSGGAGPGAAGSGGPIRSAVVPVPGVRIGFAPAGTYEPQVDLRADGRSFGVRYHQQRDGRFAVRVAEDPDPDAWDAGDLDAAARVVSVLEHTADSITVQVGIHRFSAMVVGAGDERAVAVRGRWVRLTVAPRFPETADALAPGASVSPMPGRVVEVAVAVGDEVAAGALLVIVEAMKMEHRLTAPVAGTVAEVRVTTGQQIHADEVLVVVTPEGDAPDGDGG